VIDYLEDRTGLLICDVPKGGDPDLERQFSFPHRTFQEYLAAFHLARFHPEPAEKAKVLARGDLTQWEVVLPLMARIAGAGHGSGWADGLIGRRDVAGHRKHRHKQTALDRADWQCALLAGLQLQEIGRAKVAASEDRQAILERVTGWLVEAIAVRPEAGGLTARQRVLAGDVLSRLGDPRFDSKRHFLPDRDDLGFILVRGLDHLRFAQYPVTVAQFRAFVEDRGFELGNAKALRDPDHRPVRYVNHAEALAYCEWLTRAGCLPEGWRADLLDEREWEHASRGGQPEEWDYWWEGKADPERANYDDTGIGDTSVVGCFPANGYRLYDMLGNVWEWTSSLYKKGDPYLVVRGGSWGSPAVNLRCAARYGDLPDGRYYGLGFRVVLRCSPV
jgi:Sulfatase-modifying factor enzyme 1